VPRDVFMATHGDDIQRKNSDFCCARNKVDPVAALKREAEAWVSGIRRDQSAEREGVPILLAVAGEPLKVHPIATFTSEDVHDYLRTHGIPAHPLEAKGYRSIGCEPCTRSVRPGEDERAGRWAWTDKTECGLHTDALDRRKRGAA
jgi:phosphoadenosine phosphosulfate reductase